MNKKILLVGALLGFFGVVLGAFGAHGLKGYITDAALDTFETGVKYQMYHAFVLLFVGIIKVFKESTKKYLFYLFLGGILLFSGSIYGLATNELTSFFDFKKIGFVTPVGGTLLIIGWAVMGYQFMRMKTK
ncbi:DUF423 domain-containing protein [Leptobacterium sp. I13]|uniref:DUF423 domain-containing protein n=1 Tax=Leptobacterium meishanense TaxID=3128904 RepID=UPI0030EBC8AB